jgi:DNA-binding beta-propeller fold protein YncE
MESPVGSLKRIDLATGDVTTFPIQSLLGYPYDIVVERDGTNALVTVNSRHELVRINLSTSEVTTIVSSVPELELVSPAGITLMP